MTLCNTYHSIEFELPKNLMIIFWGEEMDFGREGGRWTFWGEASAAHPPLDEKLVPIVEHV